MGKAGEQFVLHRDISMLILKTELERMHQLNEWARDSVLWITRKGTEFFFLKKKQYHNTLDAVYSSGHCIFKKIL